MEPDWEISLQETVQSQRKISLPPVVKSAVGFSHAINGPCVHLNYDRNANYIVLSSDPLQEPNYQDVDRYQIHGIDELSDSGGRIRLSDQLPDVVKTNYFEGEEVFYLAYQQMLDNENPSVFLLSATQFLKLLPTGTQQEPDELEDSLMELPAFLPPI